MAIAVAAIVGIAMADGLVAHRVLHAQDATVERRGADSVSHAFRQSLTVTPTHRAITVGDVHVTERVAPFSWRLTGPRFGLRLSGTPVQLTTPGERMNAMIPTSLRADYMLRPGDTLSVYGRSGSSPSSLNSLKVNAVGAAGTSVVDLSSQSLGLPARAGVRTVFSFPVGDLVLGVSGALEYEPAPGGDGATYWQGTTGRGALSLRALQNERTYIVSVDFAYSSADSLNGRNQFPGGGSAAIAGSVSGALGGSAGLWFSGDAFYARPFSNTRTDQPTRLIPSGDLTGISGVMLFDTGALTWSPSLSLLRESSSATVDVLSGNVRTRSALTGSAWSVAGGLSFDIPLGRIFTLSPEAGVVSGSVSSRLAQTSGVVVGRRGRTINRTTVDGVTSGIRGWWSGVGVSAKF
ncbi:MAG: hypothetical protein V4617_02070 [Gemmatimonadota bacterium]